MLLNFLRRLLNKLQTIPNPIATNEEDVLANLPQEITIDILSRLPIDTVMRCKCVCKAWRDLMESSEFATSHRSKSTAAASCLFMIQDMDSLKPYKISAFDGSSSCINSRVVSHHFGFPCNNHRYMRLIPHSSANGLLLLVDQTLRSHCLLICNPITREYMELPPPPPVHGRYYTLGFGASRVSGRYKVAMIVAGRPKCEVYSVGTGLWRSVAMAADSHSNYKHGGVGVFFNGNLHWLESDYLQASFTMISCFDLDTELFTNFAAPPPHRWGWLSALEGRLCLCNHSDGEIVIWLMNKYGDGDSWVKEFIINAPPPLYRESFDFRFIFPIKVFKDGGHILFAVEDCDQLFLYSNRTKTIQKYDRLRLCRHYSTKVVVYTPTFLSLQTMGLRYCRALMFNRF